MCLTECLDKDESLVQRKKLFWDDAEEQIWIRGHWFESESDTKYDSEKIKIQTVSRGGEMENIFDFLLITKLRELLFNKTPKLSGDQ